MFILEYLGLAFGYFVHDLGPNGASSRFAGVRQRIDWFFVADPNAERYVRSVAHEPHIRVILRRTRFADDRYFAIAFKIALQRFCRSVGNDRTEHVSH
ncbi:hypothetical protein D3C77_299480 [compost metagenome]